MAACKATLCKGIRLLEPPLLEDDREVATANQLEGHVDVVLVLNAVDQAHDGGVVERADRPHLTTSALA